MHRKKQDLKTGRVVPLGDQRGSTTYDRVCCSLPARFCWMGSSVGVCWWVLRINSWDIEVADCERAGALQASTPPQTAPPCLRGLRRRRQRRRINADMAGAFQSMAFWLPSEELVRGKAGRATVSRRH